jgi:hypothetical protein
MIGPSGCSKTLSFNIVAANMKGMESKKEFFRNSHFPFVEVFHYQCSRQSTSTEIERVFKRAIAQQEEYDRNDKNSLAVVFMDEAGLPDENRESLKVLHYYLEDQPKSKKEKKMMLPAFVGISNHSLDSAKANRAVTLFRSLPSLEELVELTKEALRSKDVGNLEEDFDKIEEFCEVFHSLIYSKSGEEEEKKEEGDERTKAISSQFKKFYGQRDFVGFIRYLIRSMDHNHISQNLGKLVRGIQRNFGGNRRFLS